MQLLGAPTWSEVMDLLQDEVTRSFRIDIETDSTIEPDATEEVQRRVDFVQIIGMYFSKTVPLLQLYPQMAPLVAANAKYLMQAMRAGREVEQSFDQAMDQFQAAVAGGAGTPQQPRQGGGPNPQAQIVTAQAAMISAQAKQKSADADTFRAQTERFKAAGQLQNQQQETQAENIRTQMEHAADAHAQGADVASEFRLAMMKEMARNFARQTAPGPLEEPPAGRRPM
jgi:hypothetical protein